MVRAAGASPRTRSFDVVLCQQGLQFFGDRVAAVREMRRTAKPGGVIAVDDLAGRLGASADGVTVRTVSNVARGVK
jgi:ubiquinone/menaquinone biosynthesis C-methylase UbiE